MKVLLLAALLSAATAQPIPLGQSGGSSSEQRFSFYPPQILPFFPQFPLQQPPLIPIPFPFPFNPNQALTPNQLLELITSILNQLQVNLFCISYKLTNELRLVFNFFLSSFLGFPWEIILTATSEVTHGGAGYCPGYLLCYLQFGTVLPSCTLCKKFCESSNTIGISIIYRPPALNKIPARTSVWISVQVFRDCSEFHENL
ncbi:uncharacterized protein LOC110342071 isoform X2 [Mesocricetus auratus]|uniref:Uncharacterized protein LOC110342071 isoform X2 n=1 Tax=Mesocricetus auratus TaxID=10036 RepID=A0ABM2XL69_MESAU|nr:uncharacterized protein LOC110342071 isoform X2 [Mesocricetus auratus]